SLFNTTLGIGTNVASLYMGAAMMRFLSGDRTAADLNDAWSAVLTVVLCLAGLAALAFAIFSGPLAIGIFGESGSPAVVCLIGAAIISDLLYEEARGFLRARRLNRLSSLMIFARLIP